MLLYCSTHSAMATEWSLYLYARSRAEAESIARPVFQEVDRVDALLSNYKQSSEISRINQAAYQQEVTTDPETFCFLETCLDWSSRSKGAFDITVGKLMKIWKFFGASGAVPSLDELGRARDEVGWQKIRLDKSRRTVRFLSPELELDPGGIGKGYAVDRAVMMLRTRQVSAALLSAGSSTIYALGAPPMEGGWKVRVPSADPQATSISTVVLQDTSLSTANLSEKNFIHDGKLYGAIMDPRTLRPVEGMVQVTVISPSATDSDALSNALFASGPEDRELLLDERQQDCALVIRGNQLAAQCEVTRWPAEVANRCPAEFACAKEN